VAARQRGLRPLPKFSVIIPTCNRPEYLSEAVASVITQTFSDFELLIVNDGDSPVASPLDPRVRILENSKRGAVAARNLGIEKSDGEFIAFLDDDDVWSAADHLFYACKILTASADFYFADGVLQFPSGDQKIFGLAADVDTLAHDNTILISAVCYKKSLHQKLGSFDLALPFYWDWDWYLRVARSGAKLQRRAKNVVDIRIHAQNMSSDNNLNERQNNLELLCAKHNLTKIALKGHVDFV
jgi:glycosyltransferase involved in cell wall biosynthesis